jgi:hypothetical protein
MKRGGPRTHRDGISGSDKLGELLLKLFDLGSRRDPTASEHFRHGLDLILFNERPMKWQKLCHRRKHTVLLLSLKPVAKPLLGLGLGPAERGKAQAGRLI